MSRIVSSPIPAQKFQAEALLTCTAQQLAVWDATSHAFRRGVRGRSFWQVPLESDSLSLAATSVPNPNDSFVSSTQLSVAGSPMNPPMNSPGTSWKFPSFFFFWEALSYAPDLQSAIMGGRDGTLVLWDINRGEAKRELSGPLRRWDVHVAKPMPHFSPFLPSGEHTKSYRKWP